MFFVVSRVEQVSTWLERLRKDGRRFDFVHGFMTGLACARADGELPDEEILLLALLDDPRHPELPPGIVISDIIGTLGELYDSIVEELHLGGFRPYMGGRYVRRIRPDTPCSEWCGGFLLTALSSVEDGEAEEELLTILSPALILAGAELGANDSFPPEERANAEELGRQGLVASVFELYGYLGPEDEEEE